MSEQKIRILLAFWTIALVGATGFLIRYSGRSGEVGTPPQFWPDYTGLAHSNSKPTLVMFLHPKCACSKASIAEFERILARYPNHFESFLIFPLPEERSDSWRQSAVWKKARELPNVHVEEDPSGELARVFDIFTSGHVLLYGTNGQLVFSGGITPSRGHEGDSSGRTIIEAFLRSESVPLSSSPVFGCGVVRNV